VSVELGIGPECGKHYWDWDLVGGYTKENIKRLTKVVQEKLKVDTWIPKSVVRGTEASDEEVDVPEDHPKLAKGKPIPAKRTADLVQYQNSGRKMIKICFPFNHDDLDRVRSLPDRKFDPDNKYWICPLTIDAVENLKDWEFLIDHHLEAFLKTAKIHVDDVEEKTVIGLKKTLYPFQQQGVSFIEAKRGRALIADEMGLGKTVQALAWLHLHPELRPAIVVVPASVKLNWAREAQAWLANPKVEILSGNTPHRTHGEILIINYDVLPGWVEALKNLNPQVLITDECHYFKNNQAKRTKAIKSLGKGISHIIALSGTPLVNRPIEIFNAIKLIDPTVVGSYFDYGRRYCGLKHNGFGWDFTGSTNAKELHEKLTSSIMLRRLKADVLPELPDKARSFIPISLDNLGEYRAAERDFIAFVRAQKGREAAKRASNAQALAEIEGLKQLAVKGKLVESVGWIADFLETDAKLVVFATHKFVIDALMAAFKNVAVKVDGSVTGVNRQRAVDEFQTNPNVRLFVGNIKAAGVGITLTAASSVAFLELPWTPGDVTQAEDRCHRIGQKDSVNIYYLLADNTIEEKIAALIDSKRKVLDAVLDGQDTEDESLLSALMNEYEEV
jgi:SNF2 family DNA or RNA helicase